MTQSETDELGRRVAVLFATFQVTFPNQFDWDYPASDLQKLKTAKAAWYRVDLGRVPGLIFEWALKQVGLQFKKIPSLKDFMDLCTPKPEMFGLPTVDEALREAARNSHPAVFESATWSHAAVYHAAAEAGLANFRVLPADALRKLFERNYTITIRAVMAGQPIREIPKALPERIERKSEPEVGNAALAQLRAARRGVAHA